MGFRPRRLVEPHPHVARQRRQERLHRRQGPARHEPDDEVLHGRPAHLRAATSPISSRPTSIPTSASRPAPSRRPRRSGAATTAPPASASAAKNTKGVRVECRIGGADLNPYLAYAALLAAGLNGIEDKLELEAGLHRRRLCRQKAARSAQDPARRDRPRSRSRKCCSEAFGQGVIDHYVHTAEWEQFEYDRRVTDWELKRGFERS